MNRIAENSLKNPTAKRGTLARKLLQVTKRQAPAALPLLDDEQRLSSKSAKVLGPYCNGAKWRLVIKEDDSRKSLVYDTEQEALAVRERLLASLGKRTVRTIGEAIE